MAQQTLDNNVLLSEQRAKINNNALDAVSQSDTTPQNLASDVDFAAGKGVQFDGGDVLDYYEEGTWTPALTTSGTDFTSVSYSALTSGKYKRIGSVVFVSGFLRTTAVTIGSASGSVIVTGLPFANANDSSADTAAVNFASAGSWLSNPNTARITQGLSSFELRIVRVYGDDPESLTPSDVNTGSEVNALNFSGFYFV